MASSVDNQLIIISLFCFSLITPVLSSGNVIIRMKSYRNTAGTVTFANGGNGCCDDPKSFPPSCNANDCDPVIDICASELRNRCDFLHQRLNPYQNVSQIAFYKMEFHFNISFWNGALFVKMEIEDMDSTGSEHMGTLQIGHSVLTPALYGSYDWMPVSMSSNGIRVDMEISVQCDKGFHDRNCYCEDKDVNGVEHTMCDRDGGRVCLAGWANPPKCLTSTLPCAASNNPCQNNATCGTFGKGAGKTTVCTCQLDYTGQHCETYIPPPSTSTTTTTTTTTSTTTTTPTTTTTTTSTTTTTPRNTTNSIVTSSVPPTTTQKIKHGTTANQKTSTTDTTKAPSTSTTLIAAATTSQPGRAVPQHPTTTTTTTTTPTSQAPVGASHASKSASGSGGGGGGGDTAAIGGGAGAAVALASGLLLLFLLRKKLCKAKDPKVSDVEREPVDDLTDGNKSSTLENQNGGGGEDGVKKTMHDEETPSPSTQHTTGDGAVGVGDSAALDF